MKTDPHRAKESALFEAVDTASAEWETAQKKSDVERARERKARRDCDAAWEKYQAASRALNAFHSSEPPSE